MTPDTRARVVAWVAEALLAAWQRQEADGRYRGADDFRALHIDPTDALTSWRAATAPVRPWPEELRQAFDREIAPLLLPLALTPADTLIAALAVAVEWEPRLRPLVAALTDDPAVRLPTLGLAAELSGAVGLTPADLRTAAGRPGRLTAYDLVRFQPVEGRPSTLDALLVAAPWWVTGAEEPLTWVDADSGAPTVAPTGSATLLSGADHRRHAEAFAAGHGGSRALLVELRPVDGHPDPRSLAAYARTARLAAAGLVIMTDAGPDPVLIETVERLAALGTPVALSLDPSASWIAPASWRQVPVPPLRSAERASRWSRALADHGRTADQVDLEQVGSEFALGCDAIADAGQRAALLSGDESVQLADLRVAARRTAWRDLSSCARPGPTGNRWSDLVVPEVVLSQLRDIAAAIGQRSRVLDEWGFGDRPGSRGYHVLFAGPSGTGKTMAVGVIAEATGLELWVVDLARVVDKYLGETEKAIDKVLRAAESCGAMLLFDEADALFGRRGEVREAKDRWANVEVAFLLQRIEEHDGVTVLTTNVSHHLDEAFARRMSQRVEFTVPDATLRRQLWLRSIPDGAPVAAADDLRVVADRFELAGGSIRTAALNAAYEAAAQSQAIGLPQLVRAGVRELTKAGRAPTRAELGELGPLVEP